MRGFVNPQPWDQVTLNASTDVTSEIWSSILQYPIGITNRLIIVREAQLLEHSRIIDLLKKRRLSPQSYVVFISSDEKIPRVEVEDGTERPAHLKAFSGKGDVVECGPFTQATAKTAVAWVRHLRPMREAVAGHLLDRANGDLRMTRDLCRKLALFDKEPSLSMVNELMREVPADTFTNALLALDRKTALLALDDVREEDYGSVIGFLDANVDFAGIVHDMLVSHKSNAEISRAVGGRRFLLPDVLPVAKHYDMKRRQSIRRLLAVADEAYRGGERKAVMEAIVAFW